MAITPQEYVLESNYTSSDFTNAMRLALANAGMFSPVPGGRIGHPHNYGMYYSGGGTGKAYESLPVIDPAHSNQSGSGAVLLVRRDSAGAMRDVILAHGGEGYGNVPVWADISQNGNSVTATIPGHSFTVGQQVGYVNWGGGVPNFSGSVTAGTSTQVTISNATARTTTSWGLLYWGKNYATWSQSGNNVNCTTLEAHGLNVGDRIYVNGAISQSSGTGLPGNTFWTVSAVSSPTQFTFVWSSTSQTVSSGVLGWHATFRIPAADIDSSTDLYVAMMASTIGQVLPGSEWLKTADSGQTGIFNATIKAGKVFPSRYYLSRTIREGVATYLSVHSTSTVNIAQGTFSGVEAITASSANRDYNRQVAFADASKRSFIRTWVSGIDPNFKVFQFVTEDKDCRLLLILHTWEPENPSVFNLNKRPSGGCTHIMKSGNRLLYSTPGQNSLGMFSIESSFSSAVSYPVIYGDIAFYSHVKAYKTDTVNYTNSDGSAEFVLFRDTVFPYSTAPGPIVTGMQFPPGILPTFYTTPSDFALLPLGGDTPLPGDTFTVSESEVWTVLMSTSELAFVARTV